tara:strand:- start:45 stop:473 length:429 start_codon:yes stop_codon:yes gene_type:complete
MEKEIDYYYDYELWDDNDTVEPAHEVTFSTIYEDAKEIMKHNRSNEESVEGSIPITDWEETPEEDKEDAIKIFKSFNRKTATFKEMDKFANLWWEYVAGAGSRAINIGRKYYKIDKEENKKEFSFFNLDPNIEAYRIEVIVK